MVFLSHPIQLLLLGLLIAMGGAPAWAQTGPAPGYASNMPAPGPYEAKLDGLLAAGDFAALNQAAYEEAKDPETVRRALNWLRAQQIAHGGSSYIAFLYSASLWRIGEATTDQAQARGFKQGAVEQFVLAQLLIQSEGFQCADRTAPGARLNNVKQLQKVLNHTKEMPKEDMQKLARALLVSMIESFKRRENDVWMCLNDRGAVESIFAPENGPKIRPEFIPYADWKDKRRAILDKIASESGAKIENYLDADHRMK